MNRATSNQDVSSDTANFARNDRESRRSLHRQTAWWPLVWPLLAGRMTISSVTQRRSGDMGPVRRQVAMKLLIYVADIALDEPVPH
jgi:hypothetical protein